MFIKIILLVAVFAKQSFQQQQNFIFVGTYDQCEGRDSGNYTFVTTQVTDAFCSQDSIVGVVGTSTVIQNLPNGQKAIIGVQTLAASRYPAGANVIVDSFILFTSGSLAGKYGYVRTKHLLRNYLKKCSSVLGLSIITYKGQLLISDKLDPNVLISPTGGYEAFKKGCTTVCNGKWWGV